MLQKIVKENGFRDIEEFNEIVASVDVSTPVKQTTFKVWQQKDGTKAGLLQLFDESSEETQSPNTLQSAEITKTKSSSATFEDIFYQKLPVSLPKSPSVIEYIHPAIIIKPIKKTNYD